MATHEQLQAAMDFDHVVIVAPDGVIIQRGPTGIHAPEMYDGEVSGPWTLMTGYTGQHGYRGPVMHASEYIGGRLADDILANPGVYVCLVSMSYDDDAGEHDADGWAIARHDDLHVDARGVVYAAGGNVADYPRGWAQCGECGRIWDDASSTGVTPAPGARCPFEDEHDGEDGEDASYDPANPPPLNPAHRY